MSKKQRERVMIFIDNWNITRNFQNLNIDCDYKKFLSKITKNRKLVMTCLYMGVKKPISKKDAIYLKYLKKVGIKPIVRAVKLSKGKIVEKRIDVLIAVDMIYNGCLNKFDKAILVSGDSDFLPAVVKLREMKKEVELWSFKSSLSQLLSNYLGKKRVFYIDDILDKIKK